MPYMVRKRFWRFLDALVLWLKCVRLYRVLCWDWKVHQVKVAFFERVVWHITHRRLQGSCPSLQAWGLALASEPPHNFPSAPHMLYGPIYWSCLFNEVGKLIWRPKLGFPSLRNSKVQAWVPGKMRHMHTSDPNPGSKCLATEVCSRSDY